MYALILLLCILALYGAYAMSINIYRLLNNDCPYDEAKDNVDEQISSWLTQQDKYYLSADPIFHNEVITIINNILSIDEFKRWYTIAFNTSIVNVQNTLPSYCILLYVPNDEYKFALKSSIVSCAKRYLSYNNLPNYIISNWLPLNSDDTDIDCTNYKWLYIRYAVTGKQIKVLEKIINSRQVEEIKAQSAPILHDSELDEELKQFNNNHRR